MAIIGFTGTRKGMQPDQLRQLRQIVQPGDELHHGDCVGADAQAHDVARAKGCRIVIHPSTLERWRAHRAGDDVLPIKSPLDRNRRIVDACEVLIAAPATAEEQLRSGTWATVRYARRVGRTVVLLLPGRG